MKKWLKVSLIIFTVLVILTFILIISFLKSTGRLEITKENLKEKIGVDNDNYIKSCNNQINLNVEKNSYFDPLEAYYYPGARAFHYGGDPVCDHVYRRSFNDPSVCEGFDNEKIKAVCVGNSISNLTDFIKCDVFSQENRDFCLLNMVWRIHYKENESLNGDYSYLCSSFLNDTFGAICSGYFYEEEVSPEICSSYGDREKLICLKNSIRKVNTNSDSQELFHNAISLCQENFDSDEFRMKCYGEAIVNFRYLLNNSLSYDEADNSYGQMLSMTFLNLTDISSSELYWMQTRELKESNPSYYERNNYYCSIHFDVPYLNYIQTYCTLMDNQDGFIDFTYDSRLPRWKYDWYNI